MATKKRIAGKPGKVTSGVSVNPGKKPKKNDKGYLSPGAYQIIKAMLDTPKTMDELKGIEAITDILFDEKVETYVSHMVNQGYVIQTRNLFKTTDKGAQLMNRQLNEHFRNEAKKKIIGQGSTSVKQQFQASCTGRTIKPIGKQFACYDGNLRPTSNDCQSGQ